MRRTLSLIAALAFVTAAHADPVKTPAPDFQPTETVSTGSVATASGTIDYQAMVGTLVVHPKGWDDTADKDDAKNPKAEATMSFVAYFKRGVAAEKRPSHSCSMVGPVPRRSGCTWAPSGPGVY